MQFLTIFDPKGVLQLYDVQSSYNKNKNIKFSPHDAHVSNNLHHVCSMSDDWKAKLNLNVFVRMNTNGSKHDNQNRRMSPMHEGGVPN